MNISRMHICYTAAEECVNPEAIHTCLQCEACGRQFKEGIMTDTGNTTNHGYTEE